MVELWDEVICELFHGAWIEMVSYSHTGWWRCTKPGCRAQRRTDARRQQHGAPVLRRRLTLL